MAPAPLPIAFTVCPSCGSFLKYDPAGAWPLYCAGCLCEVQAVSGGGRPLDREQVAAALDYHWPDIDRATGSPVEYDASVLEQVVTLAAP